jgi:hypothetical protein
MAEHNDFLSALTQIIGGELAQVNTAIPCKIVSYEAGKVAVRPTGEKRYPDGDSNPFPIVHGLRVAWPEFAGGKAGIKGPLLAGDDALMIVCQQAIDDPDDLRQFDLVDSYVIPGGSGSDAIAGNEDLRMYFGKAYIAINQDGKVTINAPGGVEEKAPTHTSNARYEIAAAKIGGVDFASHQHSGVQTGSGNTGAPVT